MRLIPAYLSLLLLPVNICFAGTAFEALKFLTPTQMRNVAMIAGRDGTPEPERWYILIHDQSSTDTGLREIVVAGGKKVAERPISQFSEKLAASDVIPPDALKTDSERVSKVAMKFGAVNDVTVSAMHFDLRKSGPENTPLWTVTCLDSSGMELGKLIVSAAKGTVLMHPGFVAEPDLDSDGDAPQNTTRRTDPPESNSPARSGGKTAVVPRRRQYQPGAQPVPAPTPKPGFLQRLFTPEKPKPAPPPPR